MTDSIVLEREGAIATVLLNRPEKLNALTKAMWQRLGEVIAELSADDRLRCLVLRGAGERAFSPGNDIGEFDTERSNAAEARAYGAIMARTLRTLRDCRHPTVALIRGVCVGGGLEIASVCDLRICGQSSRFGIPVNRLGLVMSPAELSGLLALVGRAAALEMLLEGRVFDASEAKDKGLVTRVVPDEQVLSDGYESVRRIAEGAPLVARWHKAFVRRLEETRPLSEQEQDEGYACFDTEDFKIGYRAFLAKQKPRFEGR